MNKDQLLADYLLGKLDQPDCEALEEQYFVDPETLEEIGAMQEELFDDYLTGKLQNADRARFEQRFLQTDAGRSHLRFLQGLFDWTARKARRERPWFLFSWLPEVQPVMGQEAGPELLKITGEEDQVLDIPAAGFLVVEMALSRESRHDAYQLVLAQSASNEIWRSEVLAEPAADSRLTAQIPCELLQEGQFILTAFGRSAAGELHPLLERALLFRKARYIP